MCRTTITGVFGHISSNLSSFSISAFGKATILARLHLARLYHFPIILQTGNADHEIGIFKSFRSESQVSPMVILRL